MEKKVGEDGRKRGRKREEREGGKKKRREGGEGGRGKETLK